MARSKPSPFESPLKSPRVRAAARELILAVAEDASRRELSPKAYERALKEVARLRGRPLFFPAISGATGRGARVRLADGTTRLDFISGIGVYGFGHSDQDLLETAVVAAAGDAVFQGHLFPGTEYIGLSKALLRHAGGRLKHAWLSVSGAMANENALKLIFQKHTPADHVIVFEKNFAGRSLALAEITDRPAFRDGLPLSGKVLYVPFYDECDPASTARSLAILESHLARHPGRIAAMGFEIVQGEGGFRCAPREFFVALMERCREAGLAVWIDEVQTFARTGELYAFRTLSLEDLVDVVTVGKSLQGSAALFTKAYNPRPGLIAGTYAGSTVGMAVGTRIIERLEREGYLGPEGRVAVLGGRFERRLDSFRKRMPGCIGQRSGIGAMQAFVPFDGSQQVVSAIVHRAFEEGLMVFSAGSNPTKIRMLLPVNTTDEELETGFAILEKTMRRIADERDIPC
ncbi:MAG: aminotransferase class III-fold pyridoxal phosphate-dependent enzyme [Myxococcota bacterium]